MVATILTRAYTFAIDPSAAQESALASHVGASRFAYNHLLSLALSNWDDNRRRRAGGEELSKTDWLDTTHFGLLQKWYDVRDEVAPWWAQNGASAYNDAAQRLSRAIANFHAGRSRVPRFHRSRDHCSVRIGGRFIKLLGTQHVRIARIGELKTYESTRKLARHLNRGTARIIAATLSRGGRRWKISFTVEMTREIPETRPPKREIGVDVGVCTLYTGATPAGELVLSVENPRFYQQAQRHLRRVQRMASRRCGPLPGVEPSNRWRRAYARVQKTHLKVANQRHNFIHEVTNQLATDYDRIVIEDLDVLGMLKNRGVAVFVADAAFSEFARQLAYKTVWYGSELVVADRFYPSSKTCSSCGTVKAKLSPSTRVYECEACGLVIDRDLNAAINLAGWPNKISPAGTSSVAGRGGKVRPSGRVRARRAAHPDEASTEARTKVGA